ncbi:group II intron maturase-specific domain-containing protein [Effusibacillus pohliae]|uniref:group II intron maturase-specific domain-containing protein n=1 Tax=Effusibacillus pohliae TaxID=232270 RepID=UPI000A041EDE
MWRGASAGGQRVSAVLPALSPGQPDRRTAESPAGDPQSHERELAGLAPVSGCRRVGCEEPFVDGAGGCIIIKGWRNYYAVIDPGATNRFLSKIDWYIRRRLEIFWNKKHNRRKTRYVDFYHMLTPDGLENRHFMESTYCPK